MSMLSTQPELPLPPLATAGGSVFEPGSKIALPSLLVAPGPDLAAAIGAVVLADLTPAGHIEVAAACQRLSRWSAGTQLLALAEYGRTQVWSGEPEARDDPKGVRAKQYGASDLDALTEFADREVSCALGIGALSAAAKLGMAQDLDQRLTGTRAAMLAGVLDEHKARLIVRATRVLKTSNAAVVEAQILPRAATFSYNRLKSELARLVIAADPVSASERHERAWQRRVVSKQRRDDGMGTFTADLTADGLTTVWNALDAHARASQAYTGRAQGDDRTIGQRRADGLVDLCADYLDGVLAGNLDYRPARDTTGWTNYRPTPPDNSSDTPEPTPDQPDQPGRVVARRVLSESALKRLRSVLQRRCMINVHMGADVVLGISDNPVYLEGYGWTPAPVGRRVLRQNAEMRRIIDDPVTGQALDISAKTYTPSPAMALAARMRDQLCTFPTCDPRATDCQLDHTIPHPKGRAGAGRPGDRHQTSIDGLGSLCDTEHRLKTLGGWQVVRMPDGWEWHSPHGKIYTTNYGQLLATDIDRSGHRRRHPHRVGRPRRLRARRRRIRPRRRTTNRGRCGAVRRRPGTVLIPYSVCQRVGSRKTLTLSEQVEHRQIHPPAAAGKCSQMRRCQRSRRRFSAQAPVG